MNYRPTWKLEEVVYAFSLWSQTHSSVSNNSLPLLIAFVAVFLTWQPDRCCWLLVQSLVDVFFPQCPLCLDYETRMRTTTEGAQKTDIYH